MKSISDLFNEMILLGCLIQMVNQKKDCLFNDYFLFMDIIVIQFCVFCFICCEVCIIFVELKIVFFVDLGVMMCMFDCLVCKGWIKWLFNFVDKCGVLVQLMLDGVVFCEQCYQVVGQKLYQELMKNLLVDEVVMFE